MELSSGDEDRHVIYFSILPLASNFCLLLEFNSGKSNMRWCVVLHEDYLLPECWAFAAVPRNKLSWRKFPYCTLVSSSLRHLELWKGQQAHCQLSQLKTWHHHLVVVALLIVCSSPLQVNLCTSHLVKSRIALHSSMERTVWKSVLTSISPISVPGG